MADQTTSGEDQRQVAISLCSTPASDWSIAAATGASTPRSTAGVVKLVPLESMEKVMHKSKDRDYGLDDKDQHTPEVPLIKKVAAEFIGTFILMFTVLSTIVADAEHGGAETLLGIAASAGLAVVAVVLAVVHISGSHLNPAVSLAMAAFGHLPRAHVLPYAAAQMLASAAAAALARVVFRPPVPEVMATVPSVGAAQAFFLEMVLTFVLMFVITAVATDPASATAIMMNALVGGPSTGPSMNPARTLGAALVTGKYKDIWVYMVAPPLGAIAGAGAYTLIKP
ncbi:hypothetical protein PR202_gb28805 [Eleusine coracana subsp. coracana]|uniref:Uncharacterized protein n=1 Tax=Eleusine coracana subsp. coracana TaxID=191504 RepID=A0AAV5FYF7_ELECO|nr:hypothetical protein PR202_gb28805 [Eleusine coracana subsp. coracana]